MKKETQEKQKNKKGFTLIEMLVVVLIIGILAAIALPQYQMAVTKAKVAAILPMMRHIKDSLMEWKLTNGTYCKNGSCSVQNRATIFDLGIDCPDGWTCDEESGEMENDYWYCLPNEEFSGMVYCFHQMDDSSNGFDIQMVQPDDDEIYPEYAGMMICAATIPEGHKVCKALGGKQLDDWVYQL